jgi:hypothetical protein
MNTRSFICLVALLLGLSGPRPAAGATNEWIKPTSGYWEEQASWSLGVLPDATQSLLFNNAGWKALAIGTNTAQNFPQFLHVQSLRLGAPADSYNTLLMNFAGLAQPLQTTSLIVEANSAVVMQSSALEVAGDFLLGGGFHQGDFSGVKVYGGLGVGRFGQGSYFLTNGTLAAGSIGVGGFEAGEFVQYGGSTTVGGLQINLGGEFDLHCGEVAATNGLTVGIGDYADYASFRQHGGMVEADTIINGNYILNGGSITGRMSVPGNTFQRVNGSVLQTGGTNDASSMDLGFPNQFGGAAIYDLSNGVVHVASSTAFRGGWFSQYNGLHTIVSNLVMEGTFVGRGNVYAEYLLGGGTLSVGSLAVNRLSKLTVSNGVLNAGGLAMNLVATDGVAVVNLYGGSIAVSNLIDIGLGNIVMSGGNFQTPGLGIFLGELHQSGGTSEMGMIRLPQNRVTIGQGNYYLSGGTLLSSNLSLGASGPGGFAGLNGVFDQSGGVHTNSKGIVLWGTVRSGGARPNGEYRLSTGFLVTPLVQFTEGGSFQQSGGTNRAGAIGVADGGIFSLSGGSVSSSNTSVGSRHGRYYYWSEFRSFYTQTGGSHAANEFSSGPGGLAQLQGGSLTAPSISVGPEAELELTGAAVTNSNTFTILSATRVRADGNYLQLGKLMVQFAPPSPNLPPPSSDSLLDFGTNATTLRFQDSHDTTWDSSLVVANWSGSANGGGTDRLYVGSSSQGLTAAQLSQITFVNPGGWSAGNYPARILSTGEIVPAVPPPLAFTQSANALVLSWTGDNQLLSATNVNGPYDPIPGATNPFTNPFAGPQRFFRLGVSAP